jgi:hypothetical protein
VFSLGMLRRRGIPFGFKNQLQNKEMAILNLREGYCSPSKQYGLRSE